MRVLRLGLGSVGILLMGLGAWYLTDGGREVTAALRVVPWLAGVVVLHDLLLAPLVLLAGWALWRLPAGRPVRGGLLVAGCVTLITLPALLRPGPPRDPTALPLDYPRNLTLVLAGIALVTAVLWWREVRRGGQRGQRSSTKGRP
ncbi:hypothetical protein PJ985_13645 [Streptomyces sp. ACA25]|uniref:hypothetical protein n=1 Tax=Streptomyces sp. ACA25 TaxID=3022596 RepID=UPI002306FF7B|nr:hypothetical protein [Streptomyces sp. ACA25]MDB1088611.1 hypothetical protein [Streptomyces sp. ACA25]